MIERSRLVSAVAVCCFTTVMSQATADEGERLNSAATAGICSVVNITVRENGRVLIPVTVNGQKDCRFLFDTGATTTVIGHKLAARVDLGARSTEQVRTFAGKVSLSTGRVDMLGIGDYWNAGITVLIADLGRVFNLDPEIDGILGEDILSRFNYLLDRRRRKLEIEEKAGLFPSPSGRKVYFEKQGEIILVPAAGGAVRLMLDSANPYLVVYEDAASRLQTVIPSNITGDRALASSVGRRAIRPCRIPAIEIGDSRLRNIEALLAARDSGRSEDGFLPLHFFDSIYVNNVDNFLIANPRRNRQASGDLHRPGLPE